MEAAEEKTSRILAQVRTEKQALEREMEQLKQLIAQKQQGVIIGTGGPQGQILNIPNNAKVANVPKFNSLDQFFANNLYIPIKFKIT